MVVLPSEDSVSKRGVRNAKCRVNCVYSVNGEMGYTLFPSPRPSPQGRGRIVHCLSMSTVTEFAQPPSAKHQAYGFCSLSLGETPARPLIACCALESRQTPSPGLRPPSPPVGGRAGVRGKYTA